MAPTIGANRGAHLVIQWSNDSFSSSVNSAAVVENQQGFPVVPFSFPFYFCAPNTTIQLRAFESRDGTDLWTAGDAVGRHDGTNNGNGTYSSVVVTTETMTVFLDGTGAQ
jgi:hypothetical protein